MNVCFGIQVFNGDYVLHPVIRSLTRYGHVVVAEGPVGYWQSQGFTTSTDRTNAILLLERSTAPDRVHVVHGHWDEKDEQANAYITLVPDDTDFLWMVDADEVWPPEVIERTLRLLEMNQYDSVAFKPWSFYGGFHSTIGGFEELFEWIRIQRWYKGAQWATHRPPTIVSPEDGRPWREHEHRHLHAIDSARLLGRFFHYSYVWPSQVKAKTQYYAERGRLGQGVPSIPDYYRTVWLPWVRGKPQERQAIEDQFDGVHEWLPARRGASRTQPFDGEHPRAIKMVMDELTERFYDELDQEGQGQ